MSNILSCVDVTFPHHVTNADGVVLVYWGLPGAPAKQTALWMKPIGAG